MQRVRRALREHLRFIVVTTVLTLVMTFPTILYVFRTDVFWHPASGSHDVHIKFWDIWYGRQILTGQADRFFTKLLFYPEGVSLVNHPFYLPYTSVVNVLDIVMPVSNAFSLAYLLIILACAASAYLFLHSLINDKWIALLGSVIFAFCPHVVDNRSWPDIASVGTIPLVMYCFHRGIEERRAVYVVLAGLCVGFTSLITLYHYVCVLIMLGFFICYFSLARWRDCVYWRQIALLIAVIALASAWRLAPMLQHREALTEAMQYYKQGEGNKDLIDLFVNHPRNPFLGRYIHEILQVADSGWSSNIAYLGVVPLILTVIGLFTRSTRRRVLPWLMICLLFLVLTLGSSLIFNRQHYENVLLPKHYLSDLLPFVFGAFTRTDHFMAGARLPLAVLSCFGLVALGSRFPITKRVWFICLLIMLVAMDYYLPVKHGPVFPIGDGTISKERLAFVNWLDREEDEEIRLVNLPMGRTNSKFYLFYQSLHGYPQTEGAISRTPDSAYNFIGTNTLLNIWYGNRSIACESENRGAYLAALSQLEKVGFSHVVHHRDFYNWRSVRASFEYTTPSYSDDFVSIYRLDDLRASCPQPVGSQ